MKTLYDTVHAIFSKGPKSTEEIIAECRRAGLSLRAETVELFLHLSNEMVLQEGVWRLKCGSTADEIARSLERVFSSGQTYVAIDQLSKHLDGEMTITRDDIEEVCEDSGLYQVRGKFIVRKRADI